ncbi:MAG: hypothetical protein C0508_15490 [Cyanobacteria bacterium PR.023]|jgi:predicted transcriptional regulator of viral defense system|nr:hypothetical protein [Cyanobacteria bacterium PR.023]MDQ5936001.1 AbiEi 1 protein [Cyanobacteriota bacterium erpe_2018_sw_21hr_WHONDRS-SW48-000092_B_bin.40]
MISLSHYLDEQLIRGRSYFSKAEAMKALGCNTAAFTAAASRLIRKQKLVCPWRGFYVILRPEDRVTGAPDPVRWIDPLMKYLKLDYRISLLRAAAFYGASHQAAMVFQVVAPKQLRSFEIGRHRIQFIYQTPAAFNETNKPDWLKQLKSETGFAKVAGVELLLLDCVRYFHSAGGLDGLAQIVHDLGRKADPRKLAKAAELYENSAVRRLGYLLDHFGHDRQSKALLRFVENAKSMKPLDPSAKSPIAELDRPVEVDRKWMLRINQSVEVDL